MDGVNSALKLQYQETMVLPQHVQDRRARTGVPLQLGCCRPNRVLLKEAPTWRQDVTIKILFAGSTSTLSLPPTKQWVIRAGTLVMPEHINNDGTLAMLPCDQAHTT